MLNDRPASDVEIMGEKEYRREFTEHSMLLAETGVDVMLPEFVNYIVDCVAAVDACAEAGLPVWLGVPMVTTDGITRNGETMEDLATALRGHPVQAVLLMCSRPEAISATLPRLRQAFDGVVGAYPNVGYNPMAPVGGRVHLGPDIISAQAHGPSRLAEFAQEWIEGGAQIVGGCCATGPEHIMAMNVVIRGARGRGRDVEGQASRPGA
jgi:homocysteine S-methyltransferase